MKQEERELIPKESIEKFTEKMEKIRIQTEKEME